MVKKLNIEQIKEFSTYRKWSACYACALINDRDCEYVDCRKCKYRIVKRGYKLK